MYYYSGIISANDIAVVLMEYLMYHNSSDILFNKVQILNNSVFEQCNCRICWYLFLNEEQILNNFELEHCNCQGIETHGNFIFDPCNFQNIERWWLQ